MAHNFIIVGKSSWELEVASQYTQEQRDWTPLGNGATWSGWGSSHINEWNQDNPAQICSEVNLD